MCVSKLQKIYQVSENDLEVVSVYWTYVKSICDIELEKNISL